MRFGSLFSGCGGFDLGLEQAGMTCAWQVEIDDNCQNVLRHRWPGVERFTDVREVGSANLAPVDLVCGGFPCQDVSVAGRREGLAGKRSGLFFELRRVLAELRPTWILVENVPGLLSQDEGRAMGTVLGDLGDIGYRIAYRVLDSRFFGVAQRRRRVFFVGHLGDGRAIEVLFEPESLRRHPAEGRAKGARTAATLTRGAPSGGKGGYAGRRQEDDYNIVTAPILAGGGKPGGARPGDTVDTAETLVVAHTLRGEGHDATEDGTGRGAPLVVVDALVANDGGPDARHALAGQLVAEDLDPEVAKALNSKSTGRYDLSVETLVAVAEDVADPISANEQGTYTHEGKGNFRLHNVVALFNERSVTNKDNRDACRPGDPVPTLASSPSVAFNLRGREDGSAPEVAELASVRASSGGSTRTHLAGAVGVRRLTPRECERLQGFPDDWTLHGVDASGRARKLKDGPRYQMIGNAVTVTVSRWIGRRIVASHTSPDGRITGKL